MEKYKFFEHTADFKFESYGKDLEEAFANAALALANVVIEVNEVDLNEEKTIEIQAEDLKSLLYDFLEKFLYLSDTEHFVAGKVNSLKIMKGKGFRLTATVTGDRGLEKYNYKRHVKAVTYNDMVIEEKPGNVLIRVVVDI